MGGLISKVLEQFFSKQEKRILLLGLDAAGKTTILYQLKLGETVLSVPTIGFNVETVQYKNLKWTIWDIGGQKKIRDLWKHYLANNHSIIYVLDSSDEERMEQAQQTLEWLLSSDELKGIPLLVYSNQMDMSRLSVSEITAQMGMNHIRDREWYIQGCTALTGDGLYDGLDWLSKALKSQQNN